MNVGIVKLAYIKYSELSHATRAFEEWGPTYRPKYSGYYHSSHRTEEDETKKEQEGAAIMLLTNFIMPADKKKPGDNNCIRFHSKQFHGIMKKLQFVLMSKYGQPPTALQYLKIWPNYVTTFDKYKI